MSSDVLTKRVTATGSLAVGPARVRQIQVLTGAGAGRLTVTNGNGGDTVLDIDFLASDSHSSKHPRRWYSLFYGRLRVHSDEYHRYDLLL
jgi:hypothetical protein